MATQSVSAHDDPHARRLLSDYTSMMLQMYFETPDQASTAQILDIGPVCEENIAYFARRAKRFYVCDMFLRLNRNRRNGLPTENLWEHLDYAPHIFDRINLWDFMDHLNDNESRKLVNLCNIFLKPRSMLIASSFEEPSAPSQIHSFVIKDGDQITFRLQNHLDLPWYYRSNRIITEMLSEFGTVKSFIYRNGVREFLCRSDH